MHFFFAKMMDENAAIVNLPKNNPPLQPYNKKELYEWNYKIYGLNGINKANRRDLKLLLHQANNLLVILKKEYHLE